MARPSKLTPAQWAEVERRTLAGEPARKVAPDFGISEAAIRKRFGSTEAISLQSSQVRTVAEKLAEAHAALEVLPPMQRAVAVDLADKLRSISASLACAAELGAKTAHRLQALANSQVAKVDDADPMKSIAALRDVGVLTKLANDSSSIALNLLSANKDMAGKANAQQPETPSIDPRDLSAQALAELMALKKRNAPVGG
jgi:hypothetical protein